MSKGKKIDIKRFESLVKMAEEYNIRKGKRFYPIHSREDRILVFGMYDYKTKKYALSVPFIDVEKTFDEIHEMLKTA